ADAGAPAANGAVPNGAGGVAAASSAAESDEMKPLVGYGSKATSTKRRPRKASAGSAGSNGATSGGAPAQPQDVAPEPAQPAQPVPAVPAQPVPDVPAQPVPDVPAQRGGYVPLAKPPVRKLAKDLGVDLRSLAGSGDGGVITREDVRRAVEEPPQ